MYCCLTQAGEAEAGRGQDVEANGAAERWRRSRGGRRTAAVTGGHAAGGDRYAAVLQTQQVTPSLIHVQSVPLHTLHYHWLTAKRKRDFEFRNQLRSTSRCYILLVQCLFGVIPKTTTAESSRTSFINTRTIHCHEDSKGSFTPRTVTLTIKICQLCCLDSIDGLWSRKFVLSFFKFFYFKILMILLNFGIRVWG